MQVTVHHEHPNLQTRLRMRLCAAALHGVLLDQPLQMLIRRQPASYMAIGGRVESNRMRNSMFSLARSSTS